LAAPPGEAPVLPAWLIEGGAYKSDRPGKNDLSPIGQSKQSRSPKDGAVEANWRDVQDRLLRIRANGKSFSSLRKLAAHVGCAPSTISRAINDSPLLKDWMGQKDQSGHDHDQGHDHNLDSEETWVGRSIEDNREDDPSDSVTQEEADRIVAFLIEEAEDKPVERAELNKLNDEGRRKVAMLYLQQQARLNSKEKKESLSIHIHNPASVPSVDS